MRAVRSPWPPRSTSRRPRILRRRYFSAATAAAADHAVLLAGAARRADGADDLAADHERHAALHRHGALERQQPQPVAAGGQAVLEHLGRALEARRGTRLREATSTLPCCTSSMRSKYTSSPCVSTIAIAIVQLFFFASAMAAGAIVLAVSAVIEGPYIGCACAKARAGIPAAIARHIINGAATRVMRRHYMPRVAHASLTRI